MNRKPFEELTIADDFMFCKVMEHEALCRPFLQMLFSAKIDKITYLSSQNTVTTNFGAKTVRLDVLLKDKAGTSYDIEMQVGNEYNIPKRMRYYQAVLDVAFLDKGYSYKTLNDSFIIFVCLFDPIGSNRALYTFENFCAEDRAIPLRDGTKKITFAKEKITAKVGAASQEIALDKAKHIDISEDGYQNFTLTSKLDDLRVKNVKYMVTK